MVVKIEKSVKNHKAVMHGGIFPAIKDYNQKILDFSSNVNPIGFPASVRSVFGELSKIPIYPDSDSNQLKKSLEQYTGISKDNIVVGNGATEIIYNYCHAFLRKQRALIAIPTFEEYESAIRLNGGQCRFFKTMNLNEDLQNFSKLITKNCHVFLCNPNNPTGTLLRKKNILRILDIAKDKSSVIFLDECFIELVPDFNESVVSYVKEFDNLFILRSLTKSFGLAGLRVGYAIGNKKIIDLLQRIKIPWNVSFIAQKASVKALSDKKHMAKTLQIIKKESKFLIESISKINAFSCYETNTNFILIKSKISSDLLQKKLLEKNILVRNCGSFRGLDNRFIRIAVKTHEKNLKLISALENL